MCSAGCLGRAQGLSFSRALIVLGSRGGMSPKQAAVIPRLPSNAHAEQQQLPPRGLWSSLWPCAEWRKTSLQSVLCRRGRRAAAGEPSEGAGDWLRAFRLFSRGFSRPAPAAGVGAVGTALPSGGPAARQPATPAHTLAAAAAASHALRFPSRGPGSAGTSSPGKVRGDCAGPWARPLQPADASRPKPPSQPAPAPLPRRAESPPAERGCQLGAGAVM